MKSAAVMCLLGLAGLLSSTVVATAGPPAGEGELDYAKLVSRADLHYEKPVSRSEEGVPVGNGRMGSLVWTTPEAIRLQINRVDVFANNSYSTSFPARNSDYCGGCGFVDIAFGGEVFTEEKTSQHLSCYDGLADVRGDGVAAGVLAWHEQDAMAFEISDTRKEPAAITAVLRMLRAPEVKTAAHTAVSKVESRGGRIILTQKFTEADYYCGSVVAVGIVGRKAELQAADEREIRLAAEAGRGAFTILIASAASFDPKEDLVAAALRQLAAAEKASYAGLVESNQRWWHDFWSKGYVRLHSEDGVADSIEQNYTYYLYVMASSSRGRFPAKFNGMIWITGGDKRSWGGHYWGANQECMYNALLPTNRMELLDPMFDMYSGMYDSCSTAARQQWGSQGVYIPETVAFDGLARLSEDIALEMRDLYLLNKAWDQRSERFLAVARTGQPHSSRWNWMGGGSYVDGVWQPTERGGGPFGPVTHIFSRGAKIAYTYWQRYEYTLDEAWLRDRAYPMLKGVAEFYRHYPNLRKGEDGKYHLHHVNSNESVQGGQDPDEEISSMMAILPAVIKASEILGVDAEMRPVWKEFLDHLTPLPTGGNPPVWTRALPPIFRGRGDGRPDGNTMPQWFFDLCTLENDDPETMKIANATMDGYLRGPSTRPGVLSKVGVTAAMMGRADAVHYLLPNQLSFPDRAPVLANRLDQREGVQTTNAQRLGRVADTLHNALLQSVAAGPAREPVIRVFPAWPREWDAAFSLLARGAFLVSSSIKAGKVEFVRIESQAGGECRLRNPWPDATVTLRRDGSKTEDLSGSLLVFPTRRGETVVATAVHPPTIPDAASNAAPDARLDYEPGKAPGFWSVATAETIMARWPDYNLAYHGSWTYVHGYALYGFDMLYRATGDKRYYDFIKRYIDKHIDENGEFRPVIDGRGRTRSVSFTNQDNMMTGNTLVMLYEYTKDERYRKAADTIRRALDGYPRNRNGGLWHAHSMHGQWWIDGIFMSQMFLTRYGKSIGGAKYCWDEATLQLGAYARSAERDNTGLYVHGIYEAGHGGKPARWADPNGGLSPEVWSEGLGWYALVLVETLTNLPEDHARRGEMEEIFRRLAAGLKRTQDAKSGRWFQVVDKGDRSDNWTDTSGSAMFTYTIQKGIEIGLLDKAEYAGVVEKGYKGIIENARINDKGLVDVHSACDGVGVQTSYDRYINYKQSINAKEAVAGFLWATAIIERSELEKLRPR